MLALYNNELASRDYNTDGSFANSQQEIGTTDRFILNNSEAFNTDTRCREIWWNRWIKLHEETGIKTILRKASPDFESRIKFNKSEPYSTDPENSNRFNYDQNVYSGYVSVIKVYKVVTARLGLRLEHTWVHGDFASIRTTIKQEYTNLIPNLMLTRQAKRWNPTLPIPFAWATPPYKHWTLL